MRLGTDPLHVREYEEFGEDPALLDPETQMLLERREDELALLLLDEGVTEDEFRRSLDKNPEGFIEWIRISLETRH